MHMYIQFDLMMAFRSFDLLALFFRFPVYYIAAWSAGSQGKINVTIMYLYQICYNKVPLEP